MSFTEVRGAIAQALSTVDGIEGHEYRPSPPKPGDGWVYHGSLVVDPSVGQMMRNFLVVVMQPQGNERAASEWFDTHWEDIAEVLVPHGYLDRVDLVATEQNQWVVQFSLRSE